MADRPPTPERPRELPWTARFGLNEQQQLMLCVLARASGRVHREPSPGRGRQRRNVEEGVPEGEWCVRLVVMLLDDVGDLVNDNLRHRGLFTLRAKSAGQ